VQLESKQTDQRHDAGNRKTLAIHLPPTGDCCNQLWPFYTCSSERYTKWKPSTGWPACFTGEEQMNTISNIHNLLLAKYYITLLYYELSVIIVVLFCFI